MRLVERFLELLDRLVGDRSADDGDTHLVALPLVAAVGDTLDDDLVSGHVVLDEALVRLLLELRVVGVERLEVGMAGKLHLGLGEVVHEVGVHQADGAQGAGVLGDDDVLHAKLAGD